MSETLGRQDAAQSAAYATRILSLYPDIYKKLEPFAEAAVQTHGGGYTVTEEDLSLLTAQVMQASGIMGNVPFAHNENTIRDVIRILILSSILKSTPVFSANTPIQQEQPVMFTADPALSMNNPVANTLAPFTIDDVIDG